MNREAEGSRIRSRDDVHAADEQDARQKRRRVSDGLPSAADAHAARQNADDALYERNDRERELQTPPRNFEHLNAAATLNAAEVKTESAGRYADAAAPPHARRHLNQQPNDEATLGSCADQVAPAGTLSHRGAESSTAGLSYHGNQRSTGSNPTGGAARDVPIYGQGRKDRQADIRSRTVEEAFTGSSARQTADYEMALMQFVANNDTLRRWATGGTLQGVSACLQRFQVQAPSSPSPRALETKIRRRRDAYARFLGQITAFARSAPVAVWSDSADLRILKSTESSYDYPWLRYWHDNIHLDSRSGSAFNGATSASSRHEGTTPLSSNEGGSATSSGASKSWRPQGSMLSSPLIDQHSTTEAPPSSASSSLLAAPLPRPVTSASVNSPQVDTRIYALQSQLEEQSRRMSSLQTQSERQTQLLGQQAQNLSLLQAQAERQSQLLAQQAERQSLQAERYAQQVELQSLQAERQAQKIDKQADALERIEKQLAALQALNR